MRSVKSVSSIGFKSPEKEFLLDQVEETEFKQELTRDHSKSRISFTEKERKDICEPKRMVNNTNRLIDFDAHMKDYKERTESTFPYTLTQAEDAMYLDKNTICTLEYHYIQNDCAFTNLLPVKESIDGMGNLVDEEGNFLEHPLATQYYQQTGDVHSMSGFNRGDITN